MDETLTHANKPGALLAQERVRQSLSVSEVASKLRISIRQVEALEADEYNKLPGATFVRGFMRNYARLLHLDPEPLLQASGVGGNKLADLAPVGGVSHQHIRLTPEPRGGNGGGHKVVGALAGVGLAVLVGWWLWQQWANRPRDQAVTQAVAPAATPDGSVSIPVVIPGAGQGINAPSAGAAPPAGVPVPLGVSPQAPAAAPGAQSAASAVQPSAAEPTPLGVIRFEFDAAARVEIRDKNDFVIHEELHKPADITEIQVRPPVGLVIGNAKNVKMTFNGRPIDLAPYTDVSVARFTLSDPE